MEDKAKLTTLVSMGFSVDEALALVKGNYRTVPDPAPTDPDPTPEKDPDPAPTDPDPKPAEDKPSIEDLKKSIDESFKKLEDKLIEHNINNDKQPEKQSVGDILGLMLEPTIPGREV